jgi:hypothetical protein
LADALAFAWDRSWPLQRSDDCCKTLAEGWAFGAIYGSSAERAAALPSWLRTSNHHRPHSALDCQRRPPGWRGNPTWASAAPLALAQRDAQIDVLSRSADEWPNMLVSAAPSLTAGQGGRATGPQVHRLTWRGGEGRRGSSAFPASCSFPEATISVHPDEPGLWANDDGPERRSGPRPSGTWRRHNRERRAD